MERDMFDKQGKREFERESGMNGFSQDQETRLLELLGQEIELFVEMYELTGKQSEMIAQDDVDTFGGSLDRRLELIDRINGLHQESDILMQSYALLADIEGKGKIDAIEEAAARRQDLITGCTEQNAQNGEAAKEKAGNYAKRAGRLNLIRKSLELYTLDMPNDPELFDRSL
ncbi:MAG: flagellar protein FlgN [Oscillospiraceae bacterium]|nr:flagellar protein FlgN [Oscillospiraceae bacterium]